MNTIPTLDRPIHGPRRNLYFLSDHAIRRWTDRFDGNQGSLRHAVRFSRVVARSSATHAEALWYEPDGAVFIVKVVSPNARTVVTVLEPAMELGMLADCLAVYRCRAGLCRMVTRRWEEDKLKPEPKPRRLRKCCQSFRGQYSPHLSECIWGASVPGSHELIQTH